MSIKILNKRIEELKEETNQLKIAILFKQVRTQLKLGQVEFANLLGVTQGSISKIEAAVMTPNLFTYLKFSRMFQVELI